MRRIFEIVISLFASGLLTGSSFLYSQSYDFRNFNVEDGLAQSQVFSVFQDSKGQIWFGTNGGGVSVYNGRNFRDMNTAKGLISNYVYSFAEDKAGRIFLATYDGLQILTNGSSKKIDTLSGLKSNTVFRVFGDRSGQIWVGSQEGLYILDKADKPHLFSKDEGLKSALIWTIYQDNSGKIWVGTAQRGIARINPDNPDEVTWFNTDNGIGNNFIRSINEDHRGNIIVGTNSGLFLINKNLVCSAFNLPEVKEENLAFFSIQKDAKNNYWFCTNDGVIKFSNNRITYFNTANGLPGNSVMSSLIDREQNLWFGTNGSGISRLSSERFSNLSDFNGLPGNYISSLFQDKAGNIWIGVKDNGIVRLSGERYSNVLHYKLDSKRLGSCLVDNTVNAVLEDKSGRMWFGTQAGLSILDGGRFTNMGKEKGLPSTVIYSLYQTKSGRIFAGTQAGLSEWINNGFVPVPELSALPEAKNLAVFSITEDKDGNFWLGCSSGAVSFNGRKAKHYNKSNGFTDLPSYSVCTDAAGYLWLGTENGVYLKRSNDFKNISETDGLSSNQVYLMIPDKDNFLWIGTNKGLDKLSITDLEDQTKISIRHFGKEEGLKGLECNLNAAIKDKEGKLWIGTVKGATIYNPLFDKINQQEPLCFIENIRLNFERADLSPYCKQIDSVSRLPVGLELPFSKNHITFDFIGICHTNPNKVMYQYKLEGIDDDWSPPFSKNEITFSSLPNGKYRFMLRAMNNDGVWNAEPLVFSFVVLPPWYRTWWFYSLSIILIIAGIYLYNQWKTKKLTQDKIKLEKEVALRTKELREEKEKVESINKEVIAQKAIIEHKNHEITDSIKYAKNIQEALLPNLNLLEKDFPDSFVLYMPKDIVSGDFYWFSRRKGRTLVASVDCTGHGVPGAFMSIIGNSLLNEIVGEHDILEPASILNNLHAGVKSALNQNKGEFERRDGMDIALCSLDKTTGMVDYAGANRPIWIYRNNGSGQAEIVKPNKFPIGGLELEDKREFTNHKLQLEKGDCFYIFSDGYADQFGGEKGKKFMVANLQRVLNSIYQKSMREQKEILTQTFLNWRGSFEQVDDVLVIGVRM